MFFVLSSSSILIVIAIMMLMIMMMTIFTVFRLVELSGEDEFVCLNAAWPRLVATLVLALVILRPTGQTVRVFHGAGGFKRASLGCCRVPFN